MTNSNEAKATPRTLVSGITFKGTFEPDGSGTYSIIGGVTKADGEFIVKAVNNFDSLLEACREALDFVCGCQCLSEDDCETAQNKLVSNLKQAIANATK